MVGYAHTPAIASIRPYALRYGAIWYHTTHNSVKRRAALREHWPTAPRGSPAMLGALAGSVGQPAPDVGATFRALKYE